MRCKPGDLAIIVGSLFPENIGTMVAVVGPCDFVGDWWIRSTRPLMANGGRFREVSALDKHLLPIRPDSHESTETEDELEVAE